MAIEKFPVDASHIMMFARAIGDPNQIYYDADYAASTAPGEIIAPPTFTMAGAQFDPDYEMRPKVGDTWIGSGRDTTGVVKTQQGDRSGARMHAEQHYVYHRQLSAGDVLEAEVRQGRVWEKEGGQGRKLSFEETITDFRNQHGKLVITETNVLVNVGVPEHHGA